MPNNKKHMSAGKKIGMGAGIVAATAAAAAGAYFLYGNTSAKTKRKIRGWALKAKGEVLEKIEKLERVSEDQYKKIVDQVVKKYQGLKNVDTAELLAMGAELKKHWNSLEREAGKAVKSVTKGSSRKKSK